MELNQLGNYIKNKRINLKLSLRDAAKLIGISHSYLSTIEKGIDPRSNAPIKPTPEVLQFISKAYGLEYNKLMQLAGYIKQPISDKDLTVDEANDIEVALNQTLETLEKQETLMLSGEPISDEDWEKVKNAILLGLEFAKKVNK